MEFLRNNTRVWIGDRQISAGTFRAYEMRFGPDGNRRIVFYGKDPTQVVCPLNMMSVHIEDLYYKSPSLDTVCPNSKLPIINNHWETLEIDFDTQCDMHFADNRRYPSLINPVNSEVDPGSQ